MELVEHSMLQTKVDALEFALKPRRVLASNIVTVEEAHYGATRIIEIAQEATGKKF